MKVRRSKTRRKMDPSGTRDLVKSFVREMAVGYDRLEADLRALLSGTLPGAPPVFNEHFFSRCERDDNGHCLPEGGAHADTHQGIGKTLGEHGWHGVDIKAAQEFEDKLRYVAGWVHSQGFDVQKFNEEVKSAYNSLSARRAESPHLYGPASPQDVFSGAMNETFARMQRDKARLTEEQFNQLKKEQLEKPVPAPPSQGASQAARVAVVSTRTEEQVGAHLERLLGKGTTPHDVASLVGAPAGTRVRIGLTTREQITVKMTHPDFHATRTIGRDGQGRLFIHNDEFFVKPSAQGKGLGAEVFSRQVENAQARGFDRIETWAARGSTMNGYSTWVKFGYDQSLDRLAVSNSYLAAEIREKFPHARTVQDVTLTKEGRDFWQARGDNLYQAQFDLRPGSRSLKILHSYLDEKASRKKGGRTSNVLNAARGEMKFGTEPGSGAEWPDLTEEDEGILDEILDKLGEEGVGPTVHQDFWTGNTDSFFGRCERDEKGHCLPESSGDTVEVHDPRTGEVFWTGPRGEAESMLREQEVVEPGHGLKLRLSTDATRAETAAREEGLRRAHEEKVKESLRQSELSTPHGLLPGHEGYVPPPPRLYHATFAADEIRQGGFKSSDELGSQTLGGSSGHLISFASKEDATSYAHALNLARDAAQGRLTQDEFVSRASGLGVTQARAREIALRALQEGDRNWFNAYNRVAIEGKRLPVITGGWWPAPIREAKSPASLISVKSSDIKDIRYVPSEREWRVGDFRGLAVNAGPVYNAESHFKTCERDKLGHCLPGTGGAQGTDPSSRDQQGRVGQQKPGVTGRVGAVVMAARVFGARLAGKLPNWLKLPASGLAKLSFLTTIAGNRAVQAVARERGFNPDQVQKLARVVGTADVALGGSRSAAVATALGAGVLALPASFVPWGSVSYLAYSTARNPAATLRAARGLVRRKSAAHATANDYVWNDSPVPDHANKLADALEEHDWDDWYITLLHAALDEGTDVDDCIALADTAFEDNPEDDSVASPDDTEALFADLRDVLSREPEQQPLTNANEADRLAMFRSWLRGRVDYTVGRTASESVARRHVNEAYHRGAGRTLDQVQPLGAPGLAASLPPSVVQATPEAFARDVAGLPAPAEHLGHLEARATEELAAAANDLEQRISRVVSDAIARNTPPKRLARELIRQLGISRNRAETIAQTEIVRAQAEGQLDGFSRLGVKNVGVAAEWSTADDERVCPLCESLDGAVLEITSARGLLPRHPRCRCAWKPVVDPTPARLDKGREAVAESGGDDWPGKVINLRIPIFDNGEIPDSVFQFGRLLGNAFSTNYREDQPRVPSGAREGGQWTTEGTGGDVGGLGHLGQSVLGLATAVERVGAMRSIMVQHSEEIGAVKVSGMSRSEPMREVVVDGVRFRYASGAEEHAAKSIIDYAREGVPRRLWEANRTVVFTTQQCRDDAEHAKAYGIQDFKTSADAGGGGNVMTVYNQSLNAGFFAHEGGHSLASKLGWHDDAPPRRSEYGRAQREEKPVTPYGATHRAEDFAEACRLYSSKDGRATLQSQFPKKYDALVKILGPPDKAFIGGKAVTGREGLANEYSLNYDPNQPREPGGGPGGGRWTKGGASPGPQPPLLIKKEERFALDEKTERKELNALGREENALKSKIKAGQATAADHARLKKVQERQVELRDLARSRLAGGGTGTTGKTTGKTDQGQKTVQDQKADQKPGAFQPGQHLTRDEIRARLEEAVKKTDAFEVYKAMGQEMKVIMQEASTDAGQVRAHGMTTHEQMRELLVDGVKIQWSDKFEFPHRVIVELVRQKDFPQKLWDQSSHIILSTQRNSADPYWGRMYGIPGFRSAATGGDGRVVVYKGFIHSDTLAHEAGHNLATKTWHDTSPPYNSKYGEAQIKEKPVSDYGGKSRAEDFAEACRLYANTRPYSGRFRGYAGGEHKGETIADRERLRRDFPLKYAAVYELIEGKPYRPTP